MQEGQLVMAKVQRCGGAGVWATLADGSCTSVQLTDLHDKFVPNALEGLKSEQIVRAKVTKESMSETPRVNANGDAQEQGKKGSGEKAGRKAQGRGKEMERRQVAIRGVTLRQSAGCMHSGVVLCDRVHIVALMLCRCLHLLSAVSCTEVHARIAA